MLTVTAALAVAVVAASAPAKIIAFFNCFSIFSSFTILERKSSNDGDLSLDSPSLPRLSVSRGGRRKGSIQRWSELALSYQAKRVSQRCMSAPRVWNVGLCVDVPSEIDRCQERRREIARCGQNLPPRARNLLALTGHPGARPSSDDPFTGSAASSETPSGLA